MILIAVIWCSAGAVSMIGTIPILLSNIQRCFATKVEIVIHRIFNIMCLLVLIVSSVHVWRVRKKHMVEITKKRKYFGVDQEEFNVLKSLATGIKDMI